MKLENIQAALRDSGVNGWLFFDHHRRDPLAYRILDLRNAGSPTRRWYYWIPSEGTPCKIVHRIEKHILDSLPGTSIEYSRWTEQTAALRDAIGTARRVAMQFSEHCEIPYVSNVDGGTVDLIRSLGVEVLSSADLIQMFEAVWTESQYESHIAAGKLVDEIRAEAFGLIATRLSSGAKVSEWDVASFIREAFTRAGLETDHGPIVGVNQHSADPHYEPTADRSTLIKSGDLVLIDMWAKLSQDNAVYYDITWTGYCGQQMPSACDEVFAIVAGARDAAIRTVQSAVENGRSLCGFEVDDAARNYIRERGYEQNFIHRTGHSIGTEVHGSGANMDNFESHDTRKVVSGTCFSIEPGVYLSDFGIRSEVNVYVGNRSATVTGEIQQQLLRITG